MHNLNIDIPGINTPVRFLKMTVVRKEKNTGHKRKKELPVLNLDTDLLGFVNSLEEFDLPENESSDKFETFADVDEAEQLKNKDRKTQEKTKKKGKSKSSSLAAAGEANFDDFASVLDGDDVSFAGLKKRMSFITAKEQDNIDDHSKKNKKSRVKLVEAPLPTSQQNQIDRSVSYEKTVKDVSKWSGIIQKNRDAEQLKFPLQQQQPASMNISSHTLVSTFEASTEMEKEISRLIQRDGVSFNKNENDENSVDENELPTNVLDPDQVHKELSKIRASKFFTEIKSRRQAKIKSKKYRKILGKERMRAEAEAIAAGNLSELGKLGLLSGNAEDSEIRRERRLKAEMDRARERLTLRTRKVNKWAQELLNKRHGDVDGRLKVLEQVREKERLRQEIYGVEEKFSEEESEESEVEEESEEDEEDEIDFEENENSEVQDIFDKVKEEHSTITGRHKFNATDDLKIISANLSDSEIDEDLNEEINRSIVKKSTGNGNRNGGKEIKVNDEFDGVELGDGNEDNEPVSKWQIQKNLIREAFADDQVFTEFKEEKDSIVEGEAPKSIDVTLPGWGVWGGAGISVEDSKVSGKKFVIHRKGLDPRARLDKDLKHVIINERRIKAAARAFTIPKTPFPFTTPSMHARHISQPIGKEWNTVTSFKKRIQPKIVAKAGSIIKPIKFFKQAKHV